MKAFGTTGMNFVAFRILISMSINVAVFWYVAPCCAMQRHRVMLHIVVPYYIVLCHATPCTATLHSAVLYHTALCHATPCCALNFVPCKIVLSCYAVLCHVTQCLATLHRVVPRYTVWCHGAPRCAKPHRVVLQ
jgi:hypothetical protein